MRMTVISFPSGAFIDMVEMRVAGSLKTVTVLNLVGRPRWSIPSVQPVNVRVAAS
jgi:hypothetical protein